MRFNPRARVDPNQVEDRSGQGGGGLGGGLGGGGIRLPMPGSGGGQLGVGGLVILILFFVISQCAGVGPDLTPGIGGSGDATSCQSSVDANGPDKCVVELFTESVQNYWTGALPQQANVPYQPIKTVVYSGQTASGCGTAASEMGPFYCPNDKQVYLDSTFFTEMLQGQLGAKGGPFSIGYVIAHEYGHHVQDQLGILGRMRTQQGPKSDSVKAELMADCLAGMWAKDALNTTDTHGNQIITELTQDDIARAIDAAQAVGDDRIQQRSSGRVSPEQWTHGSAEQRMHWFNVGLKEGSLKACDTFAPGAL